MQTCYNCGKQVDDNVLICPECGALVKRYSRPEAPCAAPDGPAAAQQPDEAAYPSYAAVYRNDAGKLKLRGGVMFWLVLCAIFTGYSLLGFFSMLFVHYFQELYFEVLAQYSELSSMTELMQGLLYSFECYPVYYITVAALNAVELFGLVWFMASKRRAAFWVYAAASAAVIVLQLAMGGGLGVIIYLMGPVMSWLMLRKSWSFLR